MFMLSWYNGKDGKAVCVDNTSAWNIYWALKKEAERSCTYEDYWITIYFGSSPCNPEKGGHLPPCNPGEGPRFLLKKGRDPEVRP